MNVELLEKVINGVICANFDDYFDNTINGVPLWFHIKNKLVSYLEYLEANESEIYKIHVINEIPFRILTIEEFCDFSIFFTRDGNCSIKSLKQQE